jgi:hypothetical protein
MSKQEQMSALVEQWRESGLTRTSFANQHGFGSESFNYWCKKQYNEVVKAQSPVKTLPKSSVKSPGFVEIASDPDVFPKSQPVRMELELPGGIRIKIY